CACSQKQDRTHCKYDQQYKQEHHHYFCDPLYPFLETQIDNSKTQDHNDHHKYSHKDRLPHQAAKFALDLGSVHSLKTACRHLAQIDQKPSSDRCIKHHQKIISSYPKPFVPVPLCPQRLQLIKSSGNTAARAASHRKLHDHDRESQHDQADQIDQHKSRPAILPGNVRETPHIPQTNGTPCRNQNKSQPGAKLFSLHCTFLSFF